MPIPDDYEVRVYAGVLGKIIGVYLGRPFEGRPNRWIEDQLGEITYYVHERLGKPLIVADDDISGTFTFIRALEDYGVSTDITSEQIGRTWLNYLIEERTILWWGGMGTSTEHTAYLRLKHGVPAPESGSIALNTREVAEQIGSQIFIDGWAMVCPGEPEMAADLAEKAARVSHDGEAVYGARVLAAMEAAAFYESDLKSLLDTGLSQIPTDSTISRLIQDIREWHECDGDWRATLRRIEERYGYHRYGGGCHMVPNHAVIILSLLYGEGDFQRTLMVANTAGWDTDCNSGNVGCLMGIRNGLAGIDVGPDWRGPVADRLFKISADGGDAVTDAVRESARLCQVGRALLGQAPIPQPKEGARYHFEMPGSVQGFIPDADPECAGTTALENVVGHSRSGTRALAVHFDGIAPGRPSRVGVHVFGDSDMLGQAGYSMVMSPSLYPGQTVSAHISLSDDVGSPVTAGLYLETYPTPEADQPRLLPGSSQTFQPGEAQVLEWLVPDTGGLPIVRIGLAIDAERATSGTLYLDAFTWEGVPSCRFTGEGLARLGGPVGWTDGMTRTRISTVPHGTRIEPIQDEGRGLLINGTQDWEDYRLSAVVAPHMAAEAGIAVRVGGMRRFYALLLCHPGTLRLVRSKDGDQVLAEVDFSWEPNREYRLEITTVGSRLSASVDDVAMFDVEDNALPRGAIALVNTEGRTRFSDVVIEPVT